MRELTLQLNNLLAQLAKRRGSIFNHIWYGDLDEPGVNLYRCFICDESIHFSETDEHGMQHLKDSNLLPFI